MTNNNIPHDLRKEHLETVMRLQTANPTTSWDTLSPYALKIVKYNMMLDWETFKQLYAYDWGLPCKY